jgi:coatomer protein complex subunit alpha (xenin)
MDYTTNGKFPEALIQFKNCIQMIPLSHAVTKEEEEELRNLIKSCAEYITAMECQIRRQEEPPNVSSMLSIRI